MQQRFRYVTSLLLLLASSSLLAGDASHKHDRPQVCILDGKTYSFGAKVTVKGKDKYCNVDGKWINRYPDALVRKPSASQRPTP